LIFDGGTYFSEEMAGKVTSDFNFFILFSDGLNTMTDKNKDYELQFGAPLHVFGSEQDGVDSTLLKVWCMIFLRNIFPFSLRVSTMVAKIIIRPKKWGGFYARN
jgi:hypothetical protein